MNKLSKLLILIVFFAGCVTANDRFAKVRSLSNTDPARNKDVLEHIRFLEKANGRGDCPIKVLRVEDRGEEMLAYVEFWKVQSCEVETVYKVRKAPLGGGQFKYSVAYPSAADMMTVR